MPAAAGFFRNPQEWTRVLMMPPLRFLPWGGTLSAIARGMGIAGSRFDGKRAVLRLLQVLCVPSIFHTVQTAHAADETAERAAEPEPNPRRYRFAAGASLSAGDGGWGTELAGIQQIYARAQIYRGLGAGASYFFFTASNNEGNSWPQFHAQGIEGFTEYRPFETSWLDPFARVGVVGFTHVEGIEPADRIGMQGVLGADFVLPHFAIGVHALHGFTNRAWTMFGLHTELRF